MELAVKAKEIERSPLPLTVVTDILLLNGAPSPSNGIVGIPFIGGEEMGEQKPILGSTATQFSWPRMLSDHSLQPGSSDNRMLSEKHGLLGHAHSCRSLTGSLFVLRSLLSTPTLCL